MKPKSRLGRSCDCLAYLSVKHGSVISKYTLQKKPRKMPISSWINRRFNCFYWLRLRQYMVYLSSYDYNFHYIKVYNYAMLIDIAFIIAENNMKYVACLILCKKPHHLPEGLISNTRLKLWSNVIKCGIFTCFQMEQILLHRAVVHWEATQTAVIIAERFHNRTIISSAIFLRSLSENYGSV